jgi:hypothetical protein
MIHLLSCQATVAIQTDKRRTYISENLQTTTVCRMMYITRRKMHITTYCVLLLNISSYIQFSYICVCGPSLTITCRKQAKPISLAATPSQFMQHHNVSTTNISLAEELHILFNLQYSCFINRHFVQRLVLVAIHRPAVTA